MTGSRKWTNKEKIEHTLLELMHKRRIEVAHGAAEGADDITRQVCEEHHIPCKPYPVTKEDWNKQGKAAGAIRNTKMIEDFKPQLGLAFYKLGALNRGTMDCAMKIVKKGIKVLIIPD